MAEADNKSNTSSFSCLIVDDSTYARKNMIKLINRLGGATLGEASNGNEAVIKFKELDPDLVLLDITMPECNGIEALKEILKISPAAKVIIISSVGYKEIISQALEIGAKHFVTKPYNFDYAGEIILGVVKEVEEN